MSTDLRIRRPQHGGVPLPLWTVRLTTRTSTYWGGGCRRRFTSSSGCHWRSAGSHRPAGYASGA